MKRLSFLHPERDIWPSYCQPEIDALRRGLQARNMDASDGDIYLAWSAHSETWCAGWLTLNEADMEGEVDHLLKFLGESK